MRHSFVFSLPLGASLLFAGCAPKVPPRSQLTPIPSSFPVVRPVRTNDMARARTVDAPPALLPGTNTMPATPTPVWVPFDQWAANNGFGKTQRSPSLTGFRYQAGSGDHELVITLGDTVARWQGVELWLGFAPKLIDGKPCLHHLDVEKNLAPLLEGLVPVTRTNPVIVIDPGHGGPQVGTRSVFNSRFEKEYALDWARRLQPLLASNGWTVFLTRTNDADVSISNRVALAEQVKADLFLSLHFNSSLPRTDQAGIETYCLTPAGMPSNLTRGFEDTADHLLPNNTFDQLNVQYALRLHEALLAATHGADRGVRRARFMGVLRGQNRPAVLLEGGYLSNPKEAKLIATPDYRQKLALGIAGALQIQQTVRSDTAAVVQTDAER